MSKLEDWGRLPLATTLWLRERILMSTPNFDPYLNPQHDVWVAGGKCSSISRSKAWCWNRSQHIGDHEARGGGRPPERWTDDTEHPRPKEDPNAG